MVYKSEVVSDRRWEKCKALAFILSQRRAAHLSYSCLGTSLMLSVRGGAHLLDLGPEVELDGVDVVVGQRPAGEDVVDLLVGGLEGIEVLARLEDAGQNLLVGQPRAVLVRALHGVAVVAAADVVEVVGTDDDDVAGGAAVDRLDRLACVRLHDDHRTDEQAGDSAALLLDGEFGVGVRAAPDVLVLERTQVSGPHGHPGDDRAVAGDVHEHLAKSSGATDGPLVLLMEHEVDAVRERDDVVGRGRRDEGRLEGVFDDLGLGGERTGLAVTTKEGEQRHDARFLSIEGHCWLVVGNKTAKQCSLIPDYKSHS